MTMISRLARAASAIRDFPLVACGVGPGRAAIWTLAAVFAALFRRRG